MSNKLTWDSHISGITSSLNQRVGALRRLSYHVPRGFLPQVTTSTVIAKARYCLGVYGHLRIREEDPQNGKFHDMQIVINKALRIAAGKTLADRISNKELYDSLNVLSMNQYSAVDKVSLAWMSLKDPTLPTNEFFNIPTGIQERASRSQVNGDLRQSAVTTVGQSNLPFTAIKVWNKCDGQIRSTVQTHRKAPKSVIKKFAKSLPL